MVNICNICLRTDISPHTLSEELNTFYEELCNFNHVSGLIFCSVCIHKLIKCYDFKKMCILASKKLQTWWNANEVEKTPKYLLHTEMPTTLAISDNDNRKVYFYEDPQFLKLEVQPIDQSNSKRRKVSKKTKLVKEADVPKDNDYIQNNEVIYIENDIKIEMYEDTNFIEKSNINNYTTKEISDLKTDTENQLKVNQELNDSKTKDIKNETQENYHFEDINDLESNLSDSDSDLKKSVSEIKDTNTLLKDDKCLKKRVSKVKNKAKLSENKKIDQNNRVISMKNKTFDIEDVKHLLKLKFECHGEVKDVKGNVIDPDAVLKNLDKYSDKNLILMKRIGSRSGPFNHNAIQMLSKIQDRFKAYEKVFQITYLSDEKQMAEEFQNRRKYPDYLEHEHRCEKCIKSFRNAKTLENHNRLQHNASLPYSCSLCHCHFSHARATQTHVRGCHTMVYKCKLCGDFISNHSPLCSLCDCHLSHARSTHTHVRGCHSMVYKCTLCGDFISNHRNLMLRHYSKHTGVIYTCKECGKQYRNQSSFYVHMKSVHKSRHVCRLCADAYHNNTGLNMHMLRKHAGEQFTESPDNVKCEECDIIFVNSDIYNKHIKVTHYTPQYNDAPRTLNIVKKRKSKRSKYVYSCRLCEWKGASVLSRMNHHNETHPTDDIEIVYGSRKHLCHSCGKGFKDKRSFIDHMNKHANNRAYSCTICSKSFFTKGALEVHTERHFPPKYQCQSCDKKFTTETGLRNHMKIHIGDRRHKCEICGKGFLYAPALKEHVNGVHLQIRRKRKHCAVEDD